MCEREKMNFVGFAGGRSYILFALPLHYLPPHQHICCVEYKILAGLNLVV